jgi:hypothetical protein
VGIVTVPRCGEDLSMKALFVVVLWALAGSYFGGLLERVTGLALTVPMLLGFLVAGIYLAVRITRTATSAAVVEMHPTAEQSDRLAA